MSKAKGLKRARRTNAADIETLTLHYDLPSLPTAQHKAGLAGLLLLIEAMRLQRQSPLPGVTQSNRFSAAITFTRESLLTVLDELYDGYYRDPAPRQGKGKRSRDSAPEPEESEAEDEEGKPTLRPKAHFMETIGLVDKPKWLDLWRDSLFKSVRAGNTKQPYKMRAGEPTSSGGGHLATMANDEWKQLAHSCSSVRFVGSSMLGAQNWTAELVPFQGEAWATFLLHFWPITAMTFVPAQVVMKKGESFGKVRVAPNEFVIVVPEISDLVEFTSVYPLFLKSALSESTQFEWQRRPAQSTISIPEEAALEYMAGIRGVAAGMLARTELTYAVSGFDVFHVYQKGLTPMAIWGVSSATIEPRVLDRFQAIRRSCQNPLLREHLIRNLLTGRPWYKQFDRLASTVDRGLLISGAGGGWGTAQLCRDVRKQFDLVLGSPSDGGVV